MTPLIQLQNGKRATRKADAAHGVLPRRSAENRRDAIFFTFLTPSSMFFMLERPMAERFGPRSLLMRAPPS